MKRNALYPEPSSRARDLVDRGHRFDGNESDAAEHWWFIVDPEYEAEDVLASIKALLDRTIEGCSSWVVFPLDGFRL